MNYKAFRLSFPNGVHLGDGSLEDGGINLRADTLFSALCIEALKSGGEAAIERLVSLARGGGLTLSDAFPFIDGEYYMPKPFFSVKAERKESDAKKIFKRLTHIPLDNVRDYISGEFSADAAREFTEKLANMGRYEIFDRVSLRSGDDPLPYHVGVYKFRENAGLYVIAGGDNDALALFKDLLSFVSAAGIGGKRSSGLGRFTFEEADLPDGVFERLTGGYPAYITLSVSLPKENEIERILESASYSLVRRGGYVFSDTYSDEQVRKNDLYVLSGGSVVKSRFDGDVYDVSNKGAHPVYRYAKPLFYGVEV
jgi:CRISPR-associated protein Csm4